ncbi:MAG: LysM peptidoglycan-binding domain-containing protein [Treponema sp.]|nr:LysM peptidoglycan-binding domain-containing protein [Treponema sp.]
MSKSYTVSKGDTLGAISTRHYGLAGKWTLIKNANPQLLKRKTAIDGSPLIYPGDVLIIPEEVKPTQEVSKSAPKSSVPVVLDQDAKKDISILIDGKMFTGFSGYTIKMPIDSFDSFSFSAPFDDSSKELKEAFMPFTYKQCTVYYDGELLFNGTLMTPNPESSDQEKTVTLQGYSVCGIINDSSLPDTKYPPEYNNLKLSEIANDCCGAFGFNVSVDGSEGEAFEKVEYSPGDKLFEFLKKLAEQRGLLITNKANGDLLFWTPKKETVSCSIEEGELPYISCKGSFDSQNFYSHITGYSKVEKEEDCNSYTYENSYLIKKGVLRPTSFTADDATSTDLENAVKAKAGRMFASAVAYELKVLGHHNPDGKLWKKNMAISLLAPGAMIKKRTVFCIDEVTFARSDSDGNVTTLKLVLPGARDGSLPKEFPWEE